MDPRASATPASLYSMAPDLKPVAVTRWTAQLADAECERDYRSHRLEDDRRRALLLMAIVSIARALIFWSSSTLMSAAAPTMRHWSRSLYFDLAASHRGSGARRPGA